MIELGQVVMTRQISDETFQNFVVKCMDRYMHNDWGEMDAEDIDANNYSLENGERILASYKLPCDYQTQTGDDKLWIITEWDRSVTTILFPSEY